MEYRIETKGAFRVALMTRTFTPQTGSAGIPAFWSEYYGGHWDEQVPGQFGICFSPEEGSEAWEYGIGCREELAKGLPGGFRLQEIPAATWAIFPCRGPMPQAIREVWDQIYSQWLPGSGYELVPGCDLEYYSPGDPDSPDYYTEVWVPVRKKNSAP